jgi:Na+-driven multidrug efflux pump
MRVGIPMALQFAITASGTMIMQAAINGFGEVAVASYTAASKVQNVLTQGFTSLGQTMASYCGQNYGLGSSERIKKGISSAVKANVVYSVAVGALALLLLRPAMGLFFSAGTDIDAMLPYATIYMRLCVSCYIPLGLIFIFRNAMQGCGFGLLPMLGGIVELVCRLVCAFAAMQTNNFTLAAFCDPFAWLGAGIFTAVACAHVMKQVEKILAGA